MRIQGYRPGISILVGIQERIQISKTQEAYRGCRLEPHTKASARDEAAAGEAVAEAAAETVVFSGMRAPLLFWLGRLAWAERFPVVPHRGLYVNGSFHVRTATDVPRFEPGQEAVEYLRREGYVVLANVMDQAEVAHARELFWSFLEGVDVQPPIRRDEPLTWARVKPNTYGIVWGHGSGQSRLMWFVRSRPRLLRFFELFWNTSDLIGSLEGFSFFPPEEAAASWQLGEAWLHTDQNGRSRPGLQTIQSATTLWPQDESSGGFVVVPRSWKKHGALTNRIYARSPRTPPSQQFLMVPPDDPLLYKPRRPRLLTTDAGDAVVWDSRTVHCSTPPLARRRLDRQPPADAATGGPAAETEAVAEAARPARAVAYCSLAPRERASESVILERQAALAAQQTCTHWPFDATCLPPPANANERAADGVRCVDARAKRFIGLTAAQSISWAAAMGGRARARAGLFETPEPRWLTSAQPWRREESETDAQAACADALAVELAAAAEADGEGCERVVGKSVCELLRKQRAEAALPAVRDEL